MHAPCGTATPDTRRARVQVIKAKGLRVNGPASLLDLCGQAIMADPVLSGDVQRLKEATATSGVGVALGENAVGQLRVLPQELANYLCRVFTCRLCREPTCQEGMRHKCCPRCSHRTHACHSFLLARRTLLTSWPWMGDAVISACNEATCGALHNLWLCLSCGHVGCGRTDGAHALAHNAATHHPLVVKRKRTPA